VRAKIEKERRHSWLGSVSGTEQGGEGLAQSQSGIYGGGKGKPFYLSGFQEPANKSRTVTNRKLTTALAGIGKGETIWPGKTQPNNLGGNKKIRPNDGVRTKKKTLALGKGQKIFSSDPKENGLVWQRGPN